MTEPQRGTSRMGDTVHRVVRIRDFHLKRVLGVPALFSAGAQGYGAKTPSTDRTVGVSYPHRPQDLALGAGIA